MTPKEAFLLSIIENPADDTPRLIFADWLTDNDQPDRGEFIRLQIARDANRTASTPRDKELLSLALSWDVPSEWQSWQLVFRRGFVEAVVCSILSLDKLDALFLLHPVVTVKIEQLPHPFRREPEESAQQFLEWIKKDLPGIRPSRGWYPRAADRPAP